jgi:hypothetical protein
MSMVHNKKMDIAVTVPEKEFMDWLKSFAPEVSPDADLMALIPVPDRKEIVVRVRTNKAHTIDYLKKNGRLKA